MNLILWIILTAIFWAVVGFITTLVYGFDIPKFLWDLGVLIFLIFLPVIIFIITEGYKDVNQTSNFLQEYIKSVLTFLLKTSPSILIGDAVGTLLAQITR